jgi:hypothetical protein
MRRTFDDEQRQLEEQRFRDEALIFWGREQSNLEHYAGTKALDPMALAARLGELWLQYSGQRDDHRMPVLQSSGNHLEARETRRTVAKTKSGDGAYGDGAQRKTSKATGHPAQNKVKHIDSWRKFKTPAARKKESLRRLMLRKDPLAKAIVKGLKAGPQKKKKTKTPQQIAQQKLYQSRYAAKLSGKPLPPLPGEQRAA